MLCHATNRPWTGPHWVGRSVWTAVACWFAWLSGGTADAAESVDLSSVENIEELSLESLLEKPVVGASRYEQSASEVPASVSVVTAEEIRAFGFRTLADVIRSQRGFYVTNDRMYSYVGVRGFGIPGDYNSRLLLLVDGHRVNDGIYSQAAIGNEFALDLDEVSRVELIRGPGSSIYGSNAFFGVINVVTRRGADLRGAETSVETSFLNDTQSSPAGATRHAFTGGRFSLAWGDVFGDLDLLASATYFRSAGVPALYYPEFDGNPDATCVDPALSPMTCDGVAHDLDDEEVWRGRAQAFYRGLTLSGVAAVREKVVPTAVYGTIFGDQEVARDLHGYVDLGYAARFGQVRLSAHGFYDVYGYDGMYVYDDRPQPDDPLAENRLINRDRARYQGLGAEVQVVDEIAGTGHFTGARILAGAEGRHTLKGLQENFDPSTTYLSDDGEENYLGVYGQGEATFAKRLQLSAGIRLDHYLVSFGSTFNPRLAAILTPRDSTRLKLLYGTAFRAPNIFERFYHDSESEHGQVVNPDLGPEHISTVEGVLEQYLGQNLRASVSLYRYAARQLIEMSELPDGATQFENRNAVKTVGAELELEGKWGSTRARLSHEWQRTEDADGIHLVNSPHHQLKVSLLFPLIEKRLSLGLESQYMAARMAPSGEPVASYLVTNASLLSEGLVQGLTLSLSAKNLFDEVYADPASLDHVQSTIRQDPRTFWLKGEYRY